MDNTDLSQALDDVLTEETESTKTKVKKTKTVTDENEEKKDPKYLVRLQNETYIKLSVISTITSISINELLNMASNLLIDKYEKEYESKTELKKDYSILCKTYQKYHK